MSASVKYTYRLISLLVSTSVLAGCTTTRQAPSAKMELPDRFITGSVKPMVSTPGYSAFWKQQAFNVNWMSFISTGCHKCSQVLVPTKSW